MHAEWSWAVERWNVETRVWEEVSPGVRESPFRAASNAQRISAGGDLARARNLRGKDAAVFLPPSRLWSDFPGAVA